MGAQGREDRLLHRLAERRVAPRQPRARHLPPLADRRRRRRQQRWPVQGLGVEHPLLVGRELYCPRDAPRRALRPVEARAVAPRLRRHELRSRDRRRRQLGRSLRRRGGGDGHRRPHRRVGRRVGRPREGPGKDGNPRADGGLPAALPRVHQGEGVGLLLLGAAGQHVRHGLAVQRLAGPLGRQARAPLDVAVDVDPRAAGGVVQLPSRAAAAPAAAAPAAADGVSTPVCDPEAWYGYKGPVCSTRSGGECTAVVEHRDHGELQCILCTSRPIVHRFVGRQEQCGTTSNPSMGCAYGSYGEAAATPSASAARWGGRRPCRCRRRRRRPRLRRPRRLLRRRSQAAVGRRRGPASPSSSASTSRGGASAWTSAPASGTRTGGTPS